MKHVLQAWVGELPYMQQTVLLTAVRGPDGVAKYDSVKMLLRWYRRCILISALDNRILEDPYDPDGGSFTGPSYFPAGDGWWEQEMNRIVDSYLQAIDGMPVHFHMHLMHAVEIVGYKHPNERIRHWWRQVYERFVSNLHLFPESEEYMDKRLGDSREGWLNRADEATTQ